jgi:uncharacterized protein (TIGR02996 family)
MSTQDDLLAAVLDAPDDLAARRAYARSLRAHGDPRGEFIELQLGDGHVDRQVALFEAHRDRIAGPAAPFLDARLAGGLVLYLSFRRGLVANLTIDGSDGITRFLAKADAIFATTPLQRLTFRCQEPNRDEEVAPDGMLHGDQRHPFDPGSLDALAAYPRLERLATLRLEAAPIEDEPRARLAARLGDRLVVDDRVWA